MVVLTLSLLETLRLYGKPGFSITLLTLSIFPFFAAPNKTISEQEFQNQSSRLFHVGHICPAYHFPPHSNPMLSVDSGLQVASLKILEIITYKEMLSKL